MFATLNSNMYIQLTINAFHSSGLAKKVFSDDMSGLEPVVFLKKGARVMLSMNLLSTAYWDSYNNNRIIYFRTTINHLTCQLQK